MLIYKFSKKNNKINIYIIIIIILINIPTKILNIILYIIKINKIHSISIAFSDDLIQFNLATTPSIPLLGNVK